MYPHQVFVLHSAYPDGSWRGLEKCSGTEEGCVRTFTEREAAEKALVAMGDTGDYFKIVEVTLVTPNVRGALDSAAFEKVEPVLPHQSSVPEQRIQSAPLDSMCVVCRDLIPKGSPAVFVQGKGLRHEGC